MNKSTWQRYALAGAVMASGAFVAATSAEPESRADVSIPFANHGGIRDWKADSDRGLWVQDTHGKWYYAALQSPCIGLNFADSIGFDTRPQGSFDRFSRIVVPGSGSSGCTVKTLRPSGAPAGKQKHEVAPSAAPADPTASK